MFKKHTPYQTFLFGHPAFSKTALKMLENKKAWHNQFYANVTSNIDDTIFSCMYESTTGRSVSDIRLMIAMRILKEGLGCSDEQLFEQCRFNILVRYALGLFSLDDEIPSESSYYRFYALVGQYFIKNQKNLFEEEFNKITHDQILKYNISGKNIRMDSKMIGSNIANYPRIKVIQVTLQKFPKLNKNFINSMNSDKTQILKDLAEDDVDKFIYVSEANDIRKRFELLGNLIYAIMQLPGFENRPLADLLGRVFNEQYKVEKGIVNAIPAKEVSSKSVQNPNDPEATFRNKRGNKTKGYTHNLTETCDKEVLKSQRSKKDVKKPGLIVGVQTEPVTTNDNNMYQSGIEKANNIIKDKADTLLSDGGFYSPDNETFAKDNHINPIFTGFQGNHYRYDLNYDEEKDELTVTDTLNGEILPATKRIRKDKESWRIIVTDKDGKTSRRYFNMDNILGAMRRKAVEKLPKETKQMRNNVEAAMYQLSFHLRNNKTRYRGLFKQILFGFTRSLWMNCARLYRYEVRMAR